MSTHPNHVTAPGCDPKLTEAYAELAALRSALKTERDWVASLTKDNGILLQAADATKAGALVVSQAGRIEKLTDELAAIRARVAELEQDKARYVLRGVYNIAAKQRSIAREALREISLSTGLPRAVSIAFLAITEFERVRNESGTSHEDTN